MKVLKCFVSVADAVSMPSAFNAALFLGLAYAELKVNFVEGYLC